jgi:uncharacterized protein (DUF1697 family)
MQYTVYHIAFDTDVEAIRARQSLSANVLSMGGQVWVSMSHSHGPSILVMRLPEGVTPQDFDQDMHVTKTLVTEVNPGSTDLDGTHDEGESDNGEPQL